MYWCVTYLDACSCAWQSRRPSAPRRNTNTRVYTLNHKYLSVYVRYICVLMCDVSGGMQLRVTEQTRQSTTQKYNSNDGSLEAAITETVHLSTCSLPYSIHSHSLQDIYVYVRMYIHIAINETVHLSIYSLPYSIHSHTLQDIYIYVCMYIHILITERVNPLIYSST